MTKVFNYDHAIYGRILVTYEAQELATTRDDIEIKSVKNDNGEVSLSDYQELRDIKLRALHDYQVKQNEQ